MPDDVLTPESTPAASDPHPAEPVVPTPAPSGTPPAFEADVLPPPEPNETSPEAEESPAPPNPNVEVHEKTAKAPKPEPVTPAEPPAPESNKRWYAVKVQSGREESIKDAIERRVKIEGLEEYYGQILIPVERVQEVKNGKRVVKERKKFP